ncbi:stress-activated map kinase-interacting protein 1 [Cylas formicarius]|uniref:stress-activated map kinase-interacting protein 1 n=1 Tax=Cylas formicarius TaxID=197179 RepID=UPI002958C4AE|nr:stress-activated map kinase-interacting protein 1 [Cylas formicarius]
MALYDNKYWLLSHIRNSFISTDDTGMCEVVMVGESRRVKDRILNKEPYADPESSEGEDDEVGSYNIQMDMEFGLRERSMTAARLEKLEYYSRKAAKMKHLKWEMKKDAGDNGASELFVKKAQPIPKQAVKSSLTAVLKKFTNMPQNPYMDYAKFDGLGQINIATRKYRIFLTMLPEEQRNYPIEVCCVATAKISELIGLILLKVSTKYAEATLKSVSNYGLFITEEDGEVDRDFPALDSRECIAKFGFTCLGLVEHKEPVRNISFDCMEDLPSSPESLGGKKRTTSASKAEENKQINDMMLMDGHNRAMEAPLYKSYRVNIINKVRQKSEVHLGISSEKLEIDPVAHTHSKFQLVKQKPVSYHMDMVAWCEVLDCKGPKSTFRILYSSAFGGNDRGTVSPGSSFPPTFHTSPSFKHFDFEADKDIADEIIEKVKLILELRSSEVKKEYLDAIRRKSFGKKRVFHL